jgi:hypothetical protein
VGGLLVLSALLTGALAGFIAGALTGLVAQGTASVAGGGGLGSPILAGRLVAVFAALVALVAVALDLLAVRTGRPRPPSVRRQVPQAWSRLFAPSTVAVLYGARLGVGPLTILPTWLWWGAFLVAAVGGPWSGALAGALFGGVRTLAGVALGEWVAPDAPRRMARLRAAEAPARWATGGVALLLPAVALAVA